jgi:hypothetical protein
LSELVHGSFTIQLYSFSPLLVIYIFPLSLRYG